MTLTEMRKATNLELVRWSLAQMPKAHAGAVDTLEAKSTRRQLADVSHELQRRAVQPERMLERALQVKHEGSPWLGARMVSRLSSLRRHNLIRRVSERIEEATEAGRQKAADRYAGMLWRIAAVTG